MDSPKEIVNNAVNFADKQQKELFMLKTKTTVTGGLIGLGFGLMYSNYKKLNLYVGALIGAVSGAVIGNLIEIDE